MVWHKSRPYPVSFATYDPASGVRALSSAMYTTAFAGANSASNLAVGSADTVPQGGAIINSLSLTKSGTQQISFVSANDTLTLASGGLLGGNALFTRSIGTGFAFKKN